MSKFFNFQFAAYEEYSEEMERFIKSSQDKLMLFCLDAFDFNRDRYIYYADAFRAIESRVHNCYDSDLEKLQIMFELKKE